MAGGTEFRARWAKQLVATAKRMPQGGGVLRRIDGEIRESIRAARMLDFVPSAVFLGLCRGIQDGLRKEDRQPFFDLALEIALGSALLQPLLLGGTGIFGKRPSALVRVAPQVWRLLTKKCGHATVSVQDQSAVAEFVFPPDIAAEPAFVAAIGGYAAATYAFTKHAGSIRTEQDGPTVRYFVAWVE